MLVAKARRGIGQQNFVAECRSRIKAWAAQQRQPAFLVVRNVRFWGLREFSVRALAYLLVSFAVPGKYTVQLAPVSPSGFGHVGFSEL